MYELIKKRKDALYPRRFLFFIIYKIISQGKRSISSWGFTNFLILLSLYPVSSSGEQLVFFHRIYKVSEDKIAKFSCRKILISEKWLFFYMRKRFSKYLHLCTYLHICDYCTYLPTTAKREHLITNWWVLPSSHMKGKQIFMKIFFLFPTFGAGQWWPTFWKNIQFLYELTQVKLLELALSKSKQYGSKHQNNRSQNSSFA